jgi:hypothetical protein
VRKASFFIGANILNFLIAHCRMTMRNPLRQLSASPPRLFRFPSTNISELFLSWDESAVQEQRDKAEVARIEAADSGGNLRE